VCVCVCLCMCVHTYINVYMGNVPNPHRVKSVSTKNFETKWTEFSLQQDQT